jgi:PKD repeat protein
LDVSGLPEGLKYDGASGKITGIATKAGTYTVTLTVTDSKMKYVSTITIEVEALPDWVVGTFDGWLQAIYEDSESDNLERIVIGITQVGKLSYKWYSQTDNDVMDEKDISLKKDIYGGYYITINEDWSDWKCDAVLEIKPLEIEGLFVGSIEGGGEGFEKEDGVWYKLFCSVQARQDCWIKAQDTIFSPKFVKGAITLIGMDDMRDWIWDDGYGGYLTLKYSANGAVTTSYSETEGGKAMATGSAQLVPYEVNGNITKAWLYTALKPKGRDAFGVLLFLSIDTSNGNVYGDDVTVEDYLLED